MFTALGRLLVVTAGSLLAAETIRWSFEDAAAGKLPGGWSARKTGEGSGSEWSVLNDLEAQSGSHVLAQTSSAGPKPLFNLCVCDESKHKNVEISVAVKAMKGDIDRGGGPLWRLKDANNYYICRWNPLEDNFRVYKVVEGKRTQLATADVKIAPDNWHTIRVVHIANKIQCYLDDKLHLEAEDDTFTQAGHPGLWSKADAVTHFDDFTIKDL